MMTNSKTQFLHLTPQETFELAEKIRIKKPLITGLNNSRQPFKVKSIKLENNKLIIAQLQKSSDLAGLFKEVTFNFNLNENKYFFQGIIRLTKAESLDVSIELISEIYVAHRRAKERLIIPPEYYGIIKIHYINSKLSKSFSRVVNISDLGCGLEFKTDINLKTSDIIQGDLSFPSRPPVAIECEVMHRKENYDDNNKPIYLIGLRYLFKNAQEEEVIKDLMIDLYRDIFVASKKAS
jgi:hypothetical protein